MPGTRLAWDGGLNLATDGYGGFEPDVDPPPTALPERVIVAEAIDSVSQSGTHFTPVVQTVSTEWARYRIVVGGKDVTFFRGVQTPMPTYGLESPLLYGSGSITFPQIHGAYERPGHGSLAWLKKFAKVKIQRINPDTGNVIGAALYVGFISDFNHEGHDLSCTLGGEATGRAAMQDRPVPIFPKIRDIGPIVMRTVRHKLRLSTANSPTTGIEMAETGGGSQLDYLAETLAKSTERDGDQWTVMPNANGNYRMFQKDLTTIDASVYIDGFHVVENLRRDFTEEPNRIWSQSIDSDGRRNRHLIFPGLITSPRSFPGTLNPGDSGDDVVALIWRLFSIGYLSHALGVDWTTDPDDEVTEAIEDLQDDAGLSITGSVNAATWRALFRGDNYSLNRSQQKPTAAWDYTKAFLMDATGNVLGPNPKYDRSRLLVDKTVDMGFGISPRQDKRWSKRELRNGDANWVGTITVNMGAVIDGEHNIGDPLVEGDVRDARTIKPGMNLWLPNWDNGTLVHVSGVTVNADSVEFAVDTAARDTMAVWEVIHRNRESRRSPARQWIAQNRRSGSRDDTGAVYDGMMFGKIERTFCPADTWTVIPTPAGRSGTLVLVDIQTEDDEALFGLSFWGKEVNSDWLDRKLGNPFTKAYSKDVEQNTKTWQDNRWLIDVFGDKDQPCGYWPKSLDPNAYDVVTQTGASVVGSTDVFTLSAHGYENAERVYFHSASVPAGLTADNDYWVVSSTTNTFKVSASRGGSAMDITANSSGISVSRHVATAPTVTGQYRFKAGAPYFCSGSPVIWIGIRPDRNTHVQGGRVLELLLDDGAG